MANNTKVVILCGGAGTRLREQTEFMPKPLVRVGHSPILWHIMKIYSSFGYNDFVLSLGYKGDLIKEYFLNYDWRANDFSMNLGKSGSKTHHAKEKLDWNITFVDTGLETLTAGRIKLVEKYVDGDDFLCTYGDGVANVNIKSLMDFHQKKGKKATLTAVHPTSKYGSIKFDKDGIASSFDEKPVLLDWINGGFFAMKKDVFDEISTEGMFEQTTLSSLAKRKELAIFTHEKFWHCMDTYKDYEDLNKIYNSGTIPWFDFK